MLPLIIVILTIVSPAYAQDAYEPEPSIIEAEILRIDNEKILSTPGEDAIYISRSKTPVKVVKDSANTTNTNVTPPAVPQPKIKEKPNHTPKPTVQKQSKEEDDSIMSFHFLYYMIQKYKLSDIVE